MNFIALEVMYHVGYRLQVYLYTTFESKAVVIVHWLEQRRNAKIMHIFFLVENIVLGARMGKI